MGKIEDKISKFLFGETYQEISLRNYNKGYDEGYAEGFEKGQEYIRKNNVVLQKADLDNLVSAMGKKRWSRKGRCPSCNVHTGSNHNKNCELLTIKLK